MRAVHRLADVLKNKSSHHEADQGEFEMNLDASVADLNVVVKDGDIVGIRRNVHIPSARQVNAWKNKEPK
jgi:hypothetical protein